MSTNFHIACKVLFFATAFLFAIVIFIRNRWYTPTLYKYSLVNFFKQRRMNASLWYSRFFYWIRIIIFSLMILLIGKPQFVDSKSKVTVEGIDIMLVLDVSKSMECFDDIHDRRSRWQVAKAEALQFIDKRDNDAIGLVVFGRYAIVRCPLTLDKVVLKSIISSFEIGMPSADMPQGTMLSQALITAVRRLQKSTAKSKVIVLLTDGSPTPGDLPESDVISIAKAMSIKIYTIGVGGERGEGYIDDPIFGTQMVVAPLNKALLEHIATQTGGKFFEAKKPKDLKKIYDIIDSLEKTSYQSEVYQKYHDYFLPILWTVIWLLLFELCMATFVWFIV